MRRAIIFGTGVFAEVLFFFLKQDGNMKIGGFTVDSKYRETDSYMGLPLVDFEMADEMFPPMEYGIYICMGYTGMNSVREQKFCEADKKGYEILSYRHRSAIVNAESMGRGNIIFENVTIGPFCEIGDGNVFYPCANIAHNTKMKSFNYYSLSAAVAGNVDIGSGCFFGNNCSIKDNVHIADKTLVGAGCYIGRNTEPYEVYVPSKSVKLAGKKSTDFL